MSCKSLYRLITEALQKRRNLLTLCCIIVMFGFHDITSAEGTKQLEPAGAPMNSICKIVLLQNNLENRIPFALLDCKEEYRLNIRISDFATEKIYLGFGNIINYFVDTTIYKDVNYQVKDPSGNVVSGYSLRPMPVPGAAGFIETRDQVDQGPDINNSQLGGYIPLILNPAMNGDYIIEFKLPGYVQNEIRVFKYFDVTVAKGITPIPGRLWSKAWQLGSGSVSAIQSASFSLFYIYTNDSIVTRFDCNGLAGGVWTIYSNEWGCSTTGTWNDRRHSTPGNASVQPEYRIFLNDPDAAVFPSGHIGELVDFKQLPNECDTVVTFEANVSKGGNIEILLDVPPLNPNSIGPEDVQLGYNVTAGNNILLPAWNGKNGNGIPLTNSTQVSASIRFLNGLSNIPLYDVEDNPRGFKVDIQRPAPVSGSTKLNLFWDDTRLPSSLFPGSNVTDGCVYTGNLPVSGCHNWTISQNLGDTNTVNSWWYLVTNVALKIPITLKLKPPSGNITGPDNICSGQMVGFRTASIPFAQKYIWHFSGPGIILDVETDAPDTTFSQQFSTALPQGNYSISVLGRNLQCGDGEEAYHSFSVYDYVPSPVTGISSVCNNSTNQYQLPGSFSRVHWSIRNGDIVGSPDVNPVTIRWHTGGNDTIQVLATSDDCGTRLSTLQVEVHPIANAEFVTGGEVTSCPGIPMTFSNSSLLASGLLLSRYWDWGDSHYQNGNDSVVMYSFPSTGTYTVTLKVTTDHGCETEASKQIHIIPYPEASFSWYRNCLSQAIQLMDNSTGIDLASRGWDFGTAPVTTANLSLQQPEVVFLASGQFPVRLVVANQYGCKDTVIQQVTIHNLPKAAFTYDNPCQGTGITFTDQSLAADTILKDYTWNIKSLSGNERTFHGNPAVAVFDDAANYTLSLVVTDAFGCTDTAGTILTIKPKPDCSFEYIENSENTRGKLHFNNQTTGASVYLWDFGNDITSTLAEPDITYKLEGEYTITLVATSPGGCNDTAMKQYYYIPGFWLPNAFSPDNNGHNDIFRPVTQRTTLEPYQLLIFDRWGQLIFSSSNPEKGWDGTFEGKLCEAGNYSYLIQFRGDKEGSTETMTRRGFVSLIR